MYSTWLWSGASVLIVSLVSFVGVLGLGLSEKWVRKSIFFMVALSVGALFGDALLHIIPEIFAGSGEAGQAATATAADMSATAIKFAPFGIFIGIMLFFILEKVLHWHHVHDAGEVHSPDAADAECYERHIKPIGPMVLVADGMHNLIDGVIIGVSYLVSIEVGIATTIAVIIHEIPQEIADFGVLLHAGYSKWRALWYNFLSALVAFVGVIVALVAGNSVQAFTPFALAIAAGGFIYIAGSDLVPELHKTRNVGESIWQFVAILIGFGLMVGLLVME